MKEFCFLVREAKKNLCSKNSFFYTYFYCYKVQSHLDQILISNTELHTMKNCCCRCCLPLGEQKKKHKFSICWCDICYYSAKEIKNTKFMSHLSGALWCEHKIESLIVVEVFLKIIDIMKQPILMSMPKIQHKCDIKRNPSAPFMILRCEHLDIKLITIHTCSFN